MSWAKDLVEDGKPVFNPNATILINNANILIALSNFSYKLGTLVMIMHKGEDISQVVEVSNVPGHGSPEYRIIPCTK
jgi:hypothetical protein